jgi:hypothetical protein
LVAAGSACHALLPNLVSVRFSEDDGRDHNICRDNGKYRGLVRSCGVMRWPAGLLYASRGDEEASGGPHEGHTAPEDSTAE